MKAKKVKTSAKKVVKSVAKVAPAAKPAKGNGLVLKQICAEIGIDPKTARRVLRKRMRSDVPAIGKFHAIGNRWVQDAKASSLVRATLKEYVEARA
jgi:hypothetical protein